MSEVFEVLVGESSRQKQGTFLQKPAQVLSLWLLTVYLLCEKWLCAWQGLGPFSFARTPKLPTAICITTKHSFTQLVASNIFTSSGSPWILPSQTINEWQTAIALNTGPQGRLRSAGKLWTSWKLTQEKTQKLPSENTKQHTTNRKKNLKSGAAKALSCGQTTSVLLGSYFSHSC